jgi:hypothetical protein
MSQIRITRDVQAFITLKGKDHLEDLGVEGNIILKGSLEKYCGRFWIKFM